MSDNFTKITKEEQERILKIILEEFAARGYQGASTNAIVQQAGIPKGTLFYFFGSKKAMYLYALDWAVARFIKYHQSQPASQPSDFFESLLSHMKLKMQFISQEPLLFGFFYKAFLDIPQELKEDMQSRFTEYSAAAQNTALQAIDKQKFKENIDVELAVKMIHLMLEGLLNRYTPAFINLSPEQGLALIKEIEEECLNYFEMIRFGIYR
jgi:AcrR family transcriptional regulator